MRTKSPLTEWRKRSGLSVAELATLCNVTEAEIIRIEAGEEGLIGEVQDCLTARGENVSAMASAHSAFVAFIRGEWGASAEAVAGDKLLPYGVCWVARTRATSHRSSEYPLAHCASDSNAPAR